MIKERLRMMKLSYFLKYYFHLSFTDRCKMFYYKWIKGVCRKSCIRCPYMDECWMNLIAELEEQAKINSALKEELKGNR